MQFEPARTGHLVGTIAAAALLAPLTAAADTPTFSKDVAPILFSNCATCHRAGEIGPMPLTTFAEARPWARAVKLAVTTRTMPPWGADPAVGHFANDPSLTQREVNTIAAWADGGAPEGNPRDLPALPAFAAGWQIGTPDVVLSSAPFDVLPTGRSVYNDAKLPTSFGADKFVREAEVRLGAPSITHHANAFVQEAGGRARVASYSPGTGGKAYPPGVAKLIPAGTTLILNMHYNPKGQPGHDPGTRVGLKFAAGPIRQVAITDDSSNNAIDIPPGDANYELAGKPFVFAEDSHLLTFTPRMNERGKDITYTLVRPDGTRQVLLRVPKFQYNWVFTYVLAEPIAAPRGSRLETLAHFDNSAANRNNPDPTARVKFGPEILNAYFEYTLDGQDLSRSTGALAVRAAAQEGAPEGGFGRVNRAAAERYLDARMEEWWARAKPLKTGAGEAKCLSCHTAVPYAFARTALRVVYSRATGERKLLAPTAQEERLVDTVRQRVANVATEQPYYDHTEAKKVESRGVEAVLNALVLTRYDAFGHPGSGDDATRQAMARLWEVQRPDGAWDWLNFGLEPYEANDAVFHGATLAALAAGSASGMAASGDAAGQAGVERLRGYLGTNVGSQRLFNRAWALLAASRLPGTLSPEEAAAILGDLTAAQRPDGGWAIADLGPWRWTREDGPFAPPGTIDKSLHGLSDGYATGLIVYAVREYARTHRLLAGMAAPVRNTALPAIDKGKNWLMANQQPERAGDPSWAPWRAHSLNFDREHGGEKGEPWRRMFMSDLATAFAVLALARDADPASAF